MKKLFDVTFDYFDTYRVIVEAESRKEAERIAWQEFREEQPEYDNGSWDLTYIEEVEA